MAQDFHACFGLGEDDTRIATVDADSVILAAIQGLNQKLEDENGTLRAQARACESKGQAQQQQIAELARRLAAVEQTLAGR